MLDKHITRSKTNKIIQACPDWGLDQNLQVAVVRMAEWSKAPDSR